VLRVDDGFHGSFVEYASRTAREAACVHLGLLTQHAVEGADQIDVVGEPRLDLRRRRIAQELVELQGIDARVLLLLEPVKAQELGEKRVDRRVILHAFGVVRLRHDLDVVRDQHDGDRALAQDDARDLGGRR